MLGDMEAVQPSYHGMAQSIGPTPTRTFLITRSGLMRMTTVIGRSSTMISSTVYSSRMGRLMSKMLTAVRMAVTVTTNSIIPTAIFMMGPANPDPR
jgi:hypothetical protein